MNKFFSILLIAFVSVNCFGRPVEGVVCSGTEKLEGVVVTDGFHFTKTDNVGKFVLEVSDEAEFVSIVTPSGYTATRVDGVSQFYKKLEEKTTTLRFELMPLPKSDAFVLLAVGDPQTKTDKQYNLFATTVLPDLKTTIDQYAKSNIPVITLYLGDVVWDSMPLFNNHKAGLKLLDAPVYAVIGNHDYQKELAGDKQCRAAFSECFGPTYYGFNLGNNYFIILDNIIYDTNKKYVEDVDQQQLNWLKEYVRYIPKDANIYVAMHAPVNNFRASNFVLAGGHKQILDIFSEYKLGFLTGHTHINSNFEVVPGVIEHNVASSCGAFWQYFYAPDGTPSGYQVFELKAQQTEWYFKTIGKDRNFQMELYSKGSFTDKPDAIVAKVWNWDPEWKVEWFEDGKYMGKMNQFNATDPTYRRAMEVLVQEGKITKAQSGKGNFLKPRTSFFYFSAIPDKKTKSVVVVATDRFGKKYTDTIKF